MAKNPMVKIIAALFIVAIIFSIWGGEGEQPNYALGIVKEDYEISGNHLSRTTQAALTVAFNDFFSRKELDFSLQIEFITFTKENNDLIKKTKEFLDGDWEVLAVIGATDQTSTQTLAEITAERDTVLLSPFFPTRGGEFSFNLTPTSQQLALPLKNILRNELKTEEALLLGEHPTIEVELLKNALTELGINIKEPSSPIEDFSETPILVLDPVLVEDITAEFIFVLPPSLDNLPRTNKDYFAVICPALLEERDKNLTFKENFSEIVGNPDSFAFNAHDALYFILEILHAAGSEPPNMQNSFFFFETTLLRGPTSFSQDGVLEKPLPLAIKVQGDKYSVFEQTSDLK